MQRATTLLDQAVASAHTGRDRADALAALARILIYEGDQPRAAELARQALEIPDAAPDVQMEARLALAQVLFFMRIDLDEAAAHARVVRATAEALGETWYAVHARSAEACIDTLLGRRFRRSDVDALLGECEAPLDRLQLLRDLEYDAGVLCLWNDALDDALTHIHGAYRRALDDGNEAALPMMLVHLSLASSLAGRGDDARRHADEAYEAALESGQRPQQALALALRALVHAVVGAEEAARADAQRALVLAGEAAIAARIYSTWALGLLDLSLGDLEAVADRAGPLAERLELGGVREPLRFAPDCVEALIGLGRLEKARFALSSLRERAEAGDRPIALAGAYRCQGLLAAAESQPEAGIGWFERALEQHARVPMPFERARTLLAYGAVLRRAKRKREARTMLDEARVELERLGASLWARRAHEELARIGGRTSTGDELTPTERKVAELVAQGLPNREVAVALFVAPKTVEFHLRNVFRKLGVRSRAELAHGLSGSPTPAPNTREGARKP